MKGKKSEDKSPSLLMVRSENNQNPEKNVTSPSSPKKVYFQYFMKYLKFQPVFFRLRWESGANLTRSVAVRGVGTDHSSAASLRLSRSARLPTWSTVLIWSSTSSLTSPVSANYLTERSLLSKGMVSVHVYEPEFEKHGLLFCAGCRHLSGSSSQLFRLA